MASVSAECSWSPVGGGNALNVIYWLPLARNWIWHNSWSVRKTHACTIEFLQICTKRGQCEGHWPWGIGNLGAQIVVCGTILVNETRSLKQQNRTSESQGKIAKHENVVRQFRSDIVGLESLMKVLLWLPCEFYWTSHLVGAFPLLQMNILKGV